jgi:hypothetical protein
MGEQTIPHEDIIRKVRQICTQDEEIDRIVVQLGIAGLRPDAVVLTNKRLIMFHPGLLGTHFDDYLWRDLSDAKLEEGLIGAKLLFSCKGKRYAVDYLPKEEARRVYAFAQEKEQEAAEIRRQRQMQEDAARAGHVVIGGVSAAPGAMSAPLVDDPMQKLMKLKSMLDAGLISQDEFDAKKKAILESL